MLNLADLAQLSSSYPKGVDNVSDLVRAAHKMVLPTDTLHLVQHVRSQLPPVMAQLRRSARPPFPVIFVEADLEEYNRSLGLEPSPDQKGARTGLLLVDDPATESFTLLVIDTCGDVAAKPKLLTWPLRFGMAYGAEHLAMVPDKIPPKVECLLWGYGPDIDMKPLHRFAWAEPDSRVPLDVGVAALRETQGVLRYACALLSLLNTTATLHDGPKPKNPRILLRGGTHRATTPSIVRIEIGSRVKDRESYVLKHAREGVRKRLHEVRGHYRHSARQPLSAHAPGSAWEQWEGGWRIWIAHHERGDESLGDLRHRTTVLTTHQPEGN
jgi:hypothetical protein